MTAFLFDENLPPAVGRGLRQIGFDVRVIGDPPAPARGSPDATNVEWCEANGAVLVTTDRGRKDKEILRLLRARTAVSVVFIPIGMNAIEISANFHKRVEQIESALARGRVRMAVTRQGGFRKLG